MKELLSKSVLLLIILVAFNVCYFIGVDYDGKQNAQICYVFFHIAYLLVLFTGLYVTRRRLQVLNSRLYLVSFLYLVVTLITCAVFLSSTFSRETVFVVYTIELCLYMTVFHYCFLMNRKSEELLLRELSCSSRITNLIADLRRLSIAIVDSEKKNLVDSVMSEIQSSPTMSNSAVYEIDNELQMQINKMKIEIDKMQIDELSKLKEQILINIKKRSEILKYGCLKV